MADQVTMDAGQLQAIVAQLAQQAAQQAAHQAPAGMYPAGGLQPMIGMPQPMQQQMAPVGQLAGLQPSGILVGISIPLPDGMEAPGYLQLGPEVMANPQLIPQLIMQLRNTWPVKCYPPRNNGGGFGGGGGYRNNNGYGRGGYGRRW